MTEQVSWLCSSTAWDSTSTKEMISSTSGQKEEAPRAYCALAESGSSEMVGTGQSLNWKRSTQAKCKIKIGIVSIESSFEESDFEGEQRNVGRNLPGI